MPGKVFKLIEKTLHADGYYTATVSTSEASEAAAATTPKAPHIKLWFRFDKGLIIGPEQREKLIREEQEQAAPAAAKEEIPTPAVVLVKEVEAKTTAAVSRHHHHADSSSSSPSDYSFSSSFESKLDATKRKMHDSYQQLANAKKQRMIQVIDPRDLPPPPQSSSKGKAAVVAARKKMITTNRKTKNFLDGRGGRPKLMKTNFYLLKGPDMTRDEKEIN